MSGPNPSGLCMCGCGGTTVLAKRNTREGDVKGEPKRFLVGHARKGKRRPLADRFWEKVDRRGPDECWPWTATRNPDGYGMFTVGHRPNDRSERAHRVAYELTHGPIPSEDLEGNRVCVLHRCDTPPCCNPGHLRTGTHAENMADMTAKGRSNPLRGSEQPKAKLTEANVVAIRALSEGGVGARRLAKRFGVSRAAIRHILAGKAWGHVP